MSKKLVFLLIILLLAGGLFWYVSKKTVAPVISTPAPVVTPEPTITPTSDAYSQHIETIAGNTDEVWYNIPELGVRMRMEKSFAEDVVYRYERSDEQSRSQKMGSAIFYLKSLMKNDTTQDHDGSWFGFLVKEPGRVEDAADGYVRGRLIVDGKSQAKQFLGFYIYAADANPYGIFCSLAEAGSGSESLNHLCSALQTVEEI